MNEKIQRLKNLIDGYQLSCYTEGKSSKTIEWYVCFLTKFMQFVESNKLSGDICQIDSQRISEFIRYLQTEAKVPRKDTNLSPATIQGYVRTLKAIFSWLEREDYIQVNPMNKIPVPRAPSKVINTFTLDQISSLITACEVSNSSGCRNLTIILLMLDCGLRVSEVANIEMENTKLTEGYIRVTGGKGGRERILPIGNLVQRCLWKYVHCFRPEPLNGMVSNLFLNESGLPLTRNGIQQMLKRCGRRAGLFGVRCSPHTLRHTFAKNYLLNGDDIFSLQKILGHSSLASVRTYLNLFSTDVKRQHQRFSPMDNLLVISSNTQRLIRLGSGRNKVHQGV